MTNKNPNIAKWYLIPIFILGINFIFRLINQSKIINNFPLDLINDYSGHMTMLYFLKVCGFHQLCPYWYNGYHTFLSYTPGWAFFSFPIYLIINNILLVTFISVVLLFALAAIFIYFFGKRNSFSIYESVIFFLFIFANAMSIGNFIRLGRLTELFAWIIFIPLFFLCLEYKEKKIDKFFIISFLILYTILMLSHPVVIILAHVMLFGLWLVKNYKEKIKISLLMILGLLLSSFWWGPYLKQLQNNTILNYAFGTTALDFSGQWALTNIVSIIISIAFIVLFYFYYTSIKSKKSQNLLFFFPVILLNLLFLFRISPYLPILKHVYPDTIMLFLIFFSIYFLLKTNISSLNQIIKNFFIAAIIIIPILSIIINIVHTPLFIAHTQFEEDILWALEQLPKDSKFVIIDVISQTSYSNAYYSYAPIYLNLSTPGGWSYSEKDADYVKTFKSLKNLIKEKNCENLIINAKTVQATHIVSAMEHCETLTSCGLSEVATKGEVCAYKI